MDNIPPDEWNAIVEKYPPGTAMTGTVTACPGYGVYVQLDELPSVKALLLVVHFQQNENAPRGPIAWPDDYPQVGSKINVRIAYWGDGAVRLTQLSRLD